MNFEKIIENLESGAVRLATDDEPLVAFERHEISATCALAALVVRGWRDAAPVPAPMPVEDAPKPKKKASGAKGGRPRGVPCPAVDSGRHAYGPDGQCKNCPAKKGGAAAVPPPDADAIPEALMGGV